jgi:hypothetical protein
MVVTAVVIVVMIVMVTVVMTVMLTIVAPRFTSDHVPLCRNLVRTNALLLAL